MKSHSTPPRALSAHAPDWRPRELFYIVKHGMKFTGMPAWPADGRDDAAVGDACADLLEDITK